VDPDLTRSGEHRMVTATSGRRLALVRNKNAAEVAFHLNPTADFHQREPSGSAVKALRARSLAVLVERIFAEPPGGQGLSATSRCGPLDAASDVGDHAGLVERPRVMPSVVNITRPLP